MAAPMPRVPPVTSATRPPTVPSPPPGCCWIVVIIIACFPSVACCYLAPSRAVGRADRGLPCLDSAHPTEATSRRRLRRYPFSSEPGGQRLAGERIDNTAKAPAVHGAGRGAPAAAHTRRPGG